jgi:hypothetical protein
VLDFVDVSVGAGFAILGAVGIVCVNKVLAMFKGDVMEQLFKFMVGGFAIIMVVGLADIVLLAAGQVLSLGIFAAVLIISFALFLIGLVRLIMWEGSSTEPSPG